MSIVEQLMEEMEEILPIIDDKWFDGAINSPPKANRILIYPKRGVKDEPENRGHVKYPAIAYYSSYNYYGDAYELAWYNERALPITIERYLWKLADFMERIRLPQVVEN